MSVTVMCGPIHNYVVRSHCSVHSLTHRPDYLQGVLAFDSLLVCRLAMNLTVKYSGTLTIICITSIGSFVVLHNFNW